MSRLSKQWLPSRHWEFLAVSVTVILALWLRLYHLDRFPPGLHYDEAIDLWAGLRVLAGDFMLYVERGWGREALYYYPLALVLALVSSHFVALKLTAVLCALGGMLAVYGLFRRKTSFFVAWLALAWHAVLFWSVFLSRSGNRAIILPLMLNVAVYAFWWALDTPSEHSMRKIGRYGVAGILTGLMMYTYQPARFVPFLFLAFVVFVYLFYRDVWRVNWRGWLVFTFVALVIAAPLGVFLLNHPGPEQERDWTIAPYLQMMRGNFGPVVQNALATAKMFTVRGDPLVSYNVPGRPVFVPGWTGIFFYAGLAMSLWRWRQPFYTFMLLWLGALLAPTILTISAPNHLRAIAALPPVVFFAALPLGEAIAAVAAQGARAAAVFVLVLSLVVVGLVAGATWRDYFISWPASKPADWSRNYNVHLHAIVTYLRAHLDFVRPAVISTHSIEDAHPTIVGVTLEREDVPIYWVDATQALVLPAGYGHAALFLAAGRWVDADLSHYVNLSSAPAMYDPDFSLLEVHFPAWQVESRPVRPLLEHVMFPPDQYSPAQYGQLPAVFGDKVQLVALPTLPSRARAGQILTFISAWEVLLADKGRALAMFVHVLNESGELVAQQDGLGYPLTSWRSGDRFLHVHHIMLPADLPAGRYWLQIGMYERSDGQRWLVRVNKLQGDRLFIGKLEIMRE